VWDNRELDRKRKREKISINFRGHGHIVVAQEGSGVISENKLRRKWVVSRTYLRDLYNDEVLFVHPLVNTLAQQMVLLHLILLLYQDCTR